jgi:hypothetical protein
MTPDKPGHAQQGAMTLVLQPADNGFKNCLSYLQAIYCAACSCHENMQMKCLRRNRRYHEKPLPVPGINNSTNF